MTQRHDDESLIEGKGKKGDEKGKKGDDWNGLSGHTDGEEECLLTFPILVSMIDESGG